MNDPKLTPREPSEAERLAQALTDWKSREVRDLDRLDAAAELRRLAALSESNAIDALNYESRIERLQAENDALRAMHDAAPTVEAEPVAYLCLSGESGKAPIALSADAPKITRDVLEAFPVYTHPAAPQPAAPVLAAEPWSVIVALNEDATRLLQSTMVPEPGEVSEISLHIGHGHEGYGLYVSLTEYPEEGSIHLACIEAPQPAALPELSDAEIGRLVDRMDNTHDSDLLKFARAVIAAMKGKQ